MNTEETLPFKRETTHRDKTPTDNQPPWLVWLRPWYTNQLPATFTFITFVTMLVGLGAERAEQSTLTLVAYTIAYVTGGYFGLKGSLEALRERVIDIDLLMVLAAAGAGLVGQPFEGVMLLFLFSLSNVLQTFALERTRKAIRSLMDLRPDTALVKQGEKLVTLPVEQVNPGMHIVLRPGDRIALDGEVVSGEGDVDQASLTGESMPVWKKQGDGVLAGTINQTGSLEVRVTKRPQETTLARMVKLVEEAHQEKAETQRFLDKAEQVYATGVIIFTFLVAVVPILFFNELFDTAFYRAMTVMVAASPCALIISTPASILSAIGNGARRGVLFKGGIYVEQAAKLRVVAFDKTGTLTQGQPQVTDVIVIPDTSLGEEELLALAAAIEAKSEHLVAQAILRAAKEKGLPLAEVVSFQTTAGQGVEAHLNEHTYRVGNPRFFAGYPASGLSEAMALVNQLQNEGKTSVIVARLEAEKAIPLGVIALADALRPDAAAVVRDLKQLGIEKVVMLTGDNHRVAQAVAQQAGVDDFYADLLPEDKLRLIHDLKTQYGAVAMVGDGVNDAPALASATIGMAMGAAGTDVAMETADVVLMANRLDNIPYAIALSRKTRRVLTANLTFALLMILVMLIAIFGWELPLPLAVLGHEGGTVLVSLNGLRLLAFRR
ncbi:MAG: cadmium-translocating P-type ATPase [Chloroflexi bacterium]|nr:cadmium-translocating P-type ATPase [Chloroflexota bacterium]